MIQRLLRPAIAATTLLVLVGCSAQSEPEPPVAQQDTTYTMEPVDRMLESIEPIPDWADPENPPCIKRLSDPPIVTCMTPDEVAIFNCTVSHSRDEQELQRLRWLIEKARFYNRFDALRDYRFEESSPYPVDCWPNAAETEPTGIDDADTTR